MIIFYLEEKYVTCEDCKDGLGTFPDAVQSQDDEMKAELINYCGSSFPGSY